MFSNKRKKLDGFGNIFFGNIVAHILSEKYNVGAEYEKMISIQLATVVDANIEKEDNILENFQFEDNIKEFKNTCIIDNNYIIQLLETNINISKDTCYLIDGFCQEPIIIKHIVKYFNNVNNFYCQRIINNNCFKNRYNNNNDLFIHIRAGDIFSNSNAQLNKTQIYPTYQFYKNILDKNNYDNIYIASDNIEHELCKKIIENYKVTIIDKTYLDTLMFGITCKEIIVSSGSYSFLFALFAFYTKNIYFDNKAGYIENKNGGRFWHPAYFSELNLKISS